MTDLYSQAHTDLNSILSDAGGVGLAITVTRPDGTSAEVKGTAQDIGLTIDPETGHTVSGRRASVGLPTAGLDASVGRPVVIQSEALKPWLVSYQLPSEVSATTYRITETLPDRLGLIVCFLEVWRA